MQIDRDGTLWAGTRNGFNAFDRGAETFSRFYPTIEHLSVETNYINQIVEDRFGFLWLSMHGQVIRFNRSTYEYTPINLKPYRDEEDTSSPLEIEIHADRNGDIWILSHQSPRKLLKYNFDTYSFQTYPVPEAFTPYLFREDGEGNLILFPSKQGILTFNTVESKFVYPSLERAPEFFTWPFRDALLLSTNEFLFGTTQGLIKYNPVSQDYTVYQHVPSNPTSLISSFIQSLFLDQSGMIWCGSNGFGLSVFPAKPNPFRLYTHNLQPDASLPHRYVNAVCQDWQGNIWVATLSKQLTKIETEDQTFQFFSLEEIPKTLYVDQNGILWIGTEKDLIYRLNPGETPVLIEESKGSNLGIISQIGEDQDGHLLTGTYYEDLKIIQPRENGSYEIIPHPLSDLLDPKYYYIFSSIKDFLYTGSQQGLHRIQLANQTVETFHSDPNDPHSLSNDFVLCIHESANGDVWVGTVSGLNRFDPQTKQFTRFTIDDNLPDDTIYSIQEDNLNVLWLGTNYGLIQFDQTAQEIIGHFTVDEGLQSNEFNRGASFRNSAGEMFFGGINGFNIFDPSRVQKSQYQPPLVITSFKVNGDAFNLYSLKNPNEITLNHQQRFLTFEFASLDFSNPSKNQYAYWMEGFDTDWNDVGSKRDANYNLYPGKYIFHLKGTNSDGVWKERELQLAIHIIAPYWQMVWFRITIVLLVLFIIVGIFYIRSQRLRLHNRALQELNEKLRLQIESRMQAEEEKNKLAQAIHHAAEDIIITDTQGIIEYVNPAFEKNTGYSASEVIGKKSNILKSGEHDDAFYTQLWTTITSGNIWSGRMINRKKQGDLFTEDVTISPLKDPAGNAIGYISVKRDITEQVLMEEQLRQSQKMEAIGTLSGGIAHDFNNILFAIQGYFELLCGDITFNGNTEEWYKEIKKAIQRAQDLVRQILEFSRKVDKPKTDLELNPLVKEILKLLRSTLPSTIEISSVIAENPIWIHGDATQIHQVLMNLSTNASYAMKEKGGEMDVSLSTAVINSRQSGKRLENVPPGEYAVITVKDNGAGMAPEIIDRIFEPFFTTKPEGEGTGMGLSVVHGIVKNHRGFLDVESQPEKGTAFSVYLPLSQTKVQKPELPQKREPVETSNASILYVDDESALVKMNTIRLNRAGFNVKGITESIEALKYFQSHSNEFDLIISDQTMPHMTGVELARNMLAIRPEIPIIICTGYSDQVTREQVKEIGVREYLNKPVSNDELLDAIHRSLRS